MTKITTLLFALTVQVAVSANANDSLRHCYQQLDIANSGIQTLKTENRELKAKIRTLNKTIDTQKTETDSQTLVLNFKQVQTLSIKRFAKNHKLVYGLSL